MKPLSPRIEKLREFTLDWKETHKPYVGQRIYWYLMGLTEYASAERSRRMLERLLASISVTT